jgi:hypothetical protein
LAAQYVYVERRTPDFFEVKKMTPAISILAATGKWDAVNAGCISSTSNTLPHRQIVKGVCLQKEHNVDAAAGSVRLSAQPSAGCFCGEHGGYFGAANPLPQLSCNHAMATQAECADVVQVALAAAFRYRQNMICIPETLAHSCRQSPMPHQRQASRAPRTL